MKLRIHNNKGFTLLEILTVLALTIIIMGLVFGPIVHSFNLMRRAEVMVRAQDDARLALSLVSRDLANAMYVYDNTKYPMDFPVADQDGNPVVVQAPYARVDLVLPRMRAYCTSPGHTPGVAREYRRHYIDPSTGEENVLFDEPVPICPEDGSLLELRPVEPLTPDTHVVRYFIGLKDPTKPYSNGYTHKLTAAAEDNMYVLYRAEFSPSDPKLFDKVLPADINNNLADGSFFYGLHSAEWRKISQPIVTLDGTDLIRLRYESGATIVTPTVRFEPTAIYNDPLAPTSDSGDDPEHGDTPPTVFKAGYGHWVFPYEITLEPDKSLVGSSENYFFSAIPGLGQTALDPPDHMCIYRVDRTKSPLAYKFVFNIKHYEEMKADSRYGAGEIWTSDDDTGPQRAFMVDTVKGTLDFSFPVVTASTEDGLNRAVSKAAVTDDINDSYLADVTYPYRYLRINETDDQILRNSTIAPGSVKVIGPDMTPGHSAANPVPYTRLPFLLYDPKENQYTVDPYYDDTGTGEVRFCSLQTIAGNPGPPLPPDESVFVYYEVQNNKKGDVLRANYVTKSLMTVAMGIRIYDPASGRPEFVELTNRVRLRNIRT